MADTNEGKQPLPRLGRRQRLIFKVMAALNCPLKLLKTPPKAGSGPQDDELNDNASRLKQVLEDFRIQGEIDEVHYGPVVTRYGLNPAPGTKSALLRG